MNPLFYPTVVYRGCVVTTEERYNEVAQERLRNKDVCRGEGEEARQSSRAATAGVEEV